MVVLFCKQHVRVVCLYPVQKVKIIKESSVNKRLIYTSAMFKQLLFCLAITGCQAAVHVLNDGNFEKNTQASTGMTTGSWLIKFYAPWCGHCKSLAPHYIEAEETINASEEVSNINFAEVDCTADNSKKTCKRFEIRGYPSLRFLHRSKMIEYDDLKRKADALVEYVSQDWDAILDSKDGSISILNKGGDTYQYVQDIPVPLTAFNEFVNTMKKDFVELWNMKKNIVICLVVGGMVVGWVLKSMCSGSSASKTKEE